MNTNHNNSNFIHICKIKNICIFHFYNFNIFEDISFLFTTDAGHFAQKIHTDLSKKGHYVFIDEKNIRVGDNWHNAIEKNISNCNIFVVIVTPSSLESGHIGREVMHAKLQINQLFHVFIKI